MFFIRTVVDCNKIVFAVSRVFNIKETEIKSKFEVDRSSNRPHIINVVEISPRVVWIGDVSSWFSDFNSFF